MNNNIIEKDFINKISKTVENIIAFDSSAEAFQLKEILEAGVEKNKDVLDSVPDVRGMYDDFLVKLKFISLYRLNESEILSLLSSSYTVIYSLDLFDLYEKIRYKLTSYDDLKDRDSFKEKIRRILIENKEFLTKNKLTIGQKEFSPTVGNWLKDYIAFLGTKSMNSIEKSKYFLSSGNFKNLSDIEKLKVEQLIYFFEKIKLSSATIEGLEEDFPVTLPSGEIGVYSKGAIEKIPFSISKDLREITSKKSIDVDLKQEESEIKGLKKIEGEFKDGSLEKEALEEEITNKRDVEGLKIMLQKYKPGTIEHSAIQEEIRKKS